MQNDKNNTITERLFDKSFIFLNLVFFYVFLNIAFLYLYPLFLKSLGAGKDLTGWVMGAFSIIAVISRPFMGKIACKKGEYWIISRGLALILLASLGYNLVHMVGYHMLLVRILHGIGFSAFIAGSFSLVATSYPQGKRGEVYGIIGASLMGATAIGPLFGEELIKVYGFYAIYMAATVSVLLAWMAIILVNGPSRIYNHEKLSSVQYLPLLRDRSFLFLLISTFIFAHCQSSLLNFLALLAAEKGTESGLFFFLSFSSAIFILLTMGKVIDRFGKLLFLRLSYPVLSLGVLFIPFLLTSYIFFIPALLCGAGMGLLFPVHNALAAGHGTQMEKPAVMSLFTAIYDTGFITGAVISGWLVRLSNIDMLFFIVGILGFIGFFIAMFSPIREN